MDLSSPSSAANNNNNGGTSTTTATTTPTSGNNNNSRGGGGSETTTTEKESKELKAGDSVSTDSSDPNDVMSDAYSGLRAQVRKSTEVSIDTVREEFWLATHLHVKREARPGNDASGLCLCVYWSYNIYGETDGLMDEWNDWVEALKTCWLIICFS